MVAMSVAVDAVLNHHGVLEIHFGLGVPVCVLDHDSSLQVVVERDLLVRNKRRQKCTQLVVFV